MDRMPKLWTLTREEKMKRRKQFIASKEFTEATWTMLILFNQNSQAIVRLIEAEGLMIKELQSEVSEAEEVRRESQLSRQELDGG